MEGNDKRWLRGLLAGIAIGAALAAGAALLAMPSAPPVASQSVARALTAG